MTETETETKHEHDPIPMYAGRIDYGERSWAVVFVRCQTCNDDGWFQITELEDLT